jgi:hypothetical protein
MNFSFINLRHKKKEIQSLSGPNEYSEFSSKLKSLRDYHKRNPVFDHSNVSLIHFIRFRIKS